MKKRATKNNSKIISFKKKINILNENIFSELNLSFKYFNNNYEEIYNYLFYFMTPGEKIKKFKLIFNFFSQNIFNLNLIHSIINNENKKFINNIYLNKLNIYYKKINKLINIIVNNKTFIIYFKTSKLFNYDNQNDNILENDLTKLFKLFQKVINILSNANDNCDKNFEKINLSKYKQIINPFYNLIIDSKYYSYYLLIKNNDKSFSTFISNQNIKDKNNIIKKILLNPEYEVEIFNYLYSIITQIILIIINDNGYLNNFDFDNYPWSIMFNDEYLLLEYFNDFFKFIINKYIK